MNGLVIDTTTERLLLGYATDGQRRVLNVPSQGNHARDLLPRLEELLDGGRVERIGVALGPGSFTGLRIGLATAKGLAEGWNCPVYGVDSLAAMASTWLSLHPRSPKAVLSAIDARKGRFYGTLTSREGLVLSVRDLTPGDWLGEIAGHWPGEVAVSGYQGPHLAALWPELPSGWTVWPLTDWTPALLDQLAAAQAPLATEAGPRYVRLSEAEENLQASQRLRK